MSKSFFQKISPIFLSLVLLFSFASCGATSETALSCRTATVDEDTYRYWFIKLKAYFVSGYSDITDTEAGWATQVSGQDKTYGEYVNGMIRDRIDHYLAGLVLYDQYGLALPQATEEKIDQEIDDAVQAYGSRSTYDSALMDRYGIDSRTLRKIRIIEEKFYYAYTTLFGENGKFAATSDEIDAFYRENYVRIKYYIVRKKQDYQYDSKGNKILSADGSYLLRDLNEEEREERVKKANDAHTKILSGEKKIEDYIKEEYPELEQGYPNGFYLLKNETYMQLFGATLINAAFLLPVGEIGFCENEDAFFVIQRYSLPDKGYSGSDKSQFGDIADNASAKKASAVFEEIIQEIHDQTTITEKYTVQTVK